MSDKSYNGWTNYETWAVKLWMDNEESSYRYYLELANEAFDEAEAPSVNAQLTGVEPFTREERAAINLSARLKDEYENAAADWLEESSKSASIWADLLNGALSQVNWQEIAEHMIEDR